jgi:hypothetical protein
VGDNPGGEQTVPPVDVVVFRALDPDGEERPEVAERLAQVCPLASPFC